MRTYLLVFIFFMFGLNTITKAQNGSVGQPFTSLGQAQNVASDGVYYFSLSGTNFSTYVRVGGWVQVAVDFGDGVGNLPQVTALTNAARGILSPAVLNKLGGANTVKITSNEMNFNITSTNATHVTRVVNNQCLHTGTNDNGLQGSWSGSTSSLGASCNSNSDNSLHQRIYHAACSGNGFHWIPKDNNQSISLSLYGELPASSYLQLWVQAPLVAVVVGPTINTQPSTTAQNLCINSAANALSVSATSPNGSAITYQWYSNASASNAGGTSIGGATSSSYTPPNNVVGTVYYYVICTNNQGSSTSNVSAGVTVNAAPQAAANSGSIDYLVVGGGGGGGFDGAGGGGGGQVKTGSISLASGSYAVTIGSGGANATAVGAQAGNGGSTTLSLPTPIVSIGGGGGGSKGANGATGGNGGGGGHVNYAGAAGAVGGFAGGNANGDGGGGGGGAGTAGATGSAGRNGGDGVLSSISGSATYYGGGGGGGSWGGTGTALGGLGGGGRGGLAYTPLAVAGTPNTGGGGGGAGEAQSNPGKNGGSGVVIVRYLGSPAGTGGTITQSGGYTIHTFNSNGTFAYNGSSSAVVPNVTVCGSTTATFTSTLPAGLTLDWYDAPTNGNLLSQGTSTFTTPVLASTTTYYVAVRNVSAGCVSATRTAVTATVNTTSFTSTTGASLCSTGTATLQAATAAGTINWYA
ncbi:MAG: glycine-rich domain-containing protein, partial [Flavobacteriia bacterium]